MRAASTGIVTVFPQDQTGSGIEGGQIDLNGAALSTRVATIDNVSGGLRIGTFSASGTGSGNRFQVLADGLSAQAITNTGVTYFPQIHQNSAGCTGSVSMICSGTYTPTITCVSNCTTPVGFAGMYSRVGRIVTVGWRANANNWSAAVTSFRVTLPVSSNIISTTDLTGSGGTENGGIGPSVRCEGDTANDTAICYFVDTAVGGHAFGGSFQYFVQ